MPVVAAAVCPHPPVIVPQLAGLAAAELDDLRTAADAAVAALLSADADALFVIGSCASTVRFPPSAGGCLRPWGLSVRVGPPRPSGPDLPLSLAVGAWLLDRAGLVGAELKTLLRGYQGISDTAPTAACVAVGAELAGSAERVALLVMGDGTACVGARAPGGPDPRAAGFGAEVAGALGSGDPAGLLALPPDLAAELLAEGRAAWQVLAGAVSSGLADGTGGIRATLRYAAAPYGVEYFVANWDVIRQTGAP